jgi:hypothetical protein
LKEVRNLKRGATGSTYASYKVSARKVRRRDTSASDAYRRFLAERPFSQERQTVIEAMAELGATPAEVSPARAPAMPKP